MKNLLRFSFVLLLLATVNLTAFSQNTETITFSDYGFTNAKEVSELAGKYCKMTFTKGTASSNLKYFSSTNGLRFYSGNTITITPNSTDSAITKIVITYGTTYKPTSKDMYFQNYGAFEDDNCTTWDGNAKVFELTNMNPNTKASTAYRLVSFEITYGAPSTEPQVMNVLKLSGVDDGAKVSYKFSGQVVFVNNKGIFVSCEQNGFAIRQSTIQAKQGASISGNIWGTKGTFNAIPTIVPDSSKVTVGDSTALTSDFVYSTDNLKDISGKYISVTNAIFSAEKSRYFFDMPRKQVAGVGGMYPIFGDDENKIEVKDIFYLGTQNFPYNGAYIYSQVQGIIANDGTNTYLYPVQLWDKNYTYFFDSRAKATEYGYKMVLADIEGADIIINKYYSNNYIQTVCLPINTDVVCSEGAGDKYWEYAGMMNGVMQFKLVRESKTIYAGTPYLYQPYESHPNGGMGYYTTSYKNVDLFKTPQPIEFNGYKMVGIFAQTELKTDETQKYLNNTELMTPSVDSPMIDGFSAYFDVPEFSNAQISIEGVKEITSIQQLINPELQRELKVYNLNGQFIGNTLNDLQKGIYIVNGKKMVIK